MYRVNIPSTTFARQEYVYRRVDTWRQVAGTLWVVHIENEATPTFKGLLGFRGIVMVLIYDYIQHLYRASKAK